MRVPDYLNPISINDLRYTVAWAPFRSLQSVSYTLVQTVGNDRTWNATFSSGLPSGYFTGKYIRFSDNNLFLITNSVYTSGYLTGTNTLTFVIPSSYQPVDQNPITVTGYPSYTSLSNYYASDSSLILPDGSVGYPGGVETKIPGSGPISLANFYGTIQVDMVNPVGTIGMFATTTAPSGWLKCNGAIISRTAYSRLYQEINVLYGSGDGSTTFALPDLRGVFMRGLDSGRGIDTNRSLATTTPQAFNYSHIHASMRFGDNNGNLFYAPSARTYYNDVAGKYSLFAAGSQSVAGDLGALPTITTITTEERTVSGEVTPYNRALLACIKY